MWSPFPELSLTPSHEVPPSRRPGPPDQQQPTQFPVNWNALHYELTNAHSIISSSLQSSSPQSHLDLLSNLHQSIIHAVYLLLYGFPYDTHSSQTIPLTVWPSAQNARTTILKHLLFPSARPPSSRPPTLPVVILVTDIFSEPHSNYNYNDSFGQQIDHIDPNSHPFELDPFLSSWNAICESTTQVFTIVPQSAKKLCSIVDAILEPSAHLRSLSPALVVLHISCDSFITSNLSALRSVCDAHCAHLCVEGLGLSLLAQANTPSDPRDCLELADFLLIDPAAWFGFDECAVVSLQRFQPSQFGPNPVTPLSSSWFNNIDPQSEDIPQVLIPYVKLWTVMSRIGSHTMREMIECVTTIGESFVHLLESSSDLETKYEGVACVVRISYSLLREDRLMARGRTQQIVSKVNDAIFTSMEEQAARISVLRGESEEGVFIYFSPARLLSWGTNSMPTVTNIRDFVSTLEDAAHRYEACRAGSDAFESRVAKCPNLQLVDNHERSVDLVLSFGCFRVVPVEIRGTWRNSLKDVNTVTSLTTCLATELANTPDLALTSAHLGMRLSRNTSLPRAWSDLLVRNASPSNADEKIEGNRPNLPCGKNRNVLPFAFYLHTEMAALIPDFLSVEPRTASAPVDAVHQAYLAAEIIINAVNATMTKWSGDEAIPLSMPHSANASSSSDRRSTRPQPVASRAHHEMEYTGATLPYMYDANATHKRNEQDEMVGSSSIENTNVGGISDEDFYSADSAEDAQQQPNGDGGGPKSEGRTWKRNAQTFHSPNGQQNEQSKHTSYEKEVSPKGIAVGQYDPSNRGTDCQEQFTSNESSSGIEGHPSEPFGEESDHSFAADSGLDADRENSMEQDKLEESTVPRIVGNGSTQRVTSTNIGAKSKKTEKSTTIVTSRILNWFQRSKNASTHSPPNTEPAIPVADGSYPREINAEQRKNTQQREHFQFAGSSENGVYTENMAIGDYGPPADDGSNELSTTAPQLSHSMTEGNNRKPCEEEASNENAETSLIDSGRSAAGANSSETETISSPAESASGFRESGSDSDYSKNNDLEEQAEVAVSGEQIGSSSQKVSMDNQGPQAQPGEVPDTLASNILNWFQKPKTRTMPLVSKTEPTMNALDEANEADKKRENGVSRKDKQKSHTRSEKHEHFSKVEAIGDYGPPDSETDSSENSTSARESVSTMSPGYHSVLSENESLDGGVQSATSDQESPAGSGESGESFSEDPELVAGSDCNGDGNRSQMPDGAAHYLLEGGSGRKSSTKFASPQKQDAQKDISENSPTFVASKILNWFQKTGEKTSLPEQKASDVASGQLDSTGRFDQNIPAQSKSKESDTLDNDQKAIEKPFAQKRGIPSRCKPFERDDLNTGRKSTDKRVSPEQGQTKSVLSKGVPQKSSLMIDEIASASDSFDSRKFSSQNEGEETQEDESSQSELDIQQHAVNPEDSAREWGPSRVLKWFHGQKKDNTNGSTAIGCRTETLKMSREIENTSDQGLRRSYAYERDTVVRLDTSTSESENLTETLSDESMKTVESSGTEHQTQSDQPRSEEVIDASRERFSVSESWQNKIAQFKESGKRMGAPQSTISSSVSEERTRGAPSHKKRSHIRGTSETRRKHHVPSLDGSPSVSLGRGDSSSNEDVYSGSEGTSSTKETQTELSTGETIESESSVDDENHEEDGFGSYIQSASEQSGSDASNASLSIRDEHMPRADEISEKMDTWSENSQNSYQMLTRSTSAAITQSSRATSEQTSGIDTKQPDRARKSTDGTITDKSIKDKQKGDGSSWRGVNWLRSNVRRWVKHDSITQATNAREERNIRCSSYGTSEKHEVTASSGSSSSASEHMESSVSQSQSISRSEGVSSDEIETNTASSATISETENTERSESSGKSLPSQRRLSERDDRAQRTKEGVKRARSSDSENWRQIRKSRSKGMRQKWDSKARRDFEHMIVARRNTRAGRIREYFAWVSPW